MKDLLKQNARSEMNKELKRNAELFRVDDSLNDDEKVFKRKVTGFTRSKVKQNDRTSGSIYRTINGIKCFIRYKINYNEASNYSNCAVQVFSKIHSKTLYYTFEDIDRRSFVPIGAIRKLEIKFRPTVNCDLYTSGPPQTSGEPYLGIVKSDHVDDVYI